VSFQALSDARQYSLRQADKERLLLAELNRLTAHHQQHCASYARITAVIGSKTPAASLEEVAYLPVGLFKSHALSSVAPTQAFKTVTSSGTTGQQVSRIVVDRETAWRQTTTLGRIVSHVIGPQRLPMILIETSATVNDRKRFTARGAGLLGLMNFGRSHFFALDDDMGLDGRGFDAFLDRFARQPFLIVGFTFMVWQYFYSRIRHLGLDLSHGILLHSGGWKTLQRQAVTHQEFRRAFRASTGLTRIHNFYGMAEQLGTIYMEDEDGCLCAPNAGDVIVRDPVTLEPAPCGTPGIIQVLSALPLSYPGHSILTDDVGVIHGIDDSPRGRLGKRFSVLGRVPRADLRGCSDVHAWEASVQ
jgi:hypothetical protein